MTARVVRGDGGAWAGRRALRWLVAGDWRAHPSRLLLTAIAIAVGVALGFAVNLVNGSALTAFAGAVRTVNGDADLQVVGTSPLGFDERLYPRVAFAPGISDASPVVVLAARRGRTRFTLLGLDVIRAAAVTPSLVGLRGGLESGGDGVFDPQALFLSGAAMRALHTRPGSHVLISANGHAVTLRVAGMLPGVAEGQTVGVIDIAAAQWRFGRLGRLDRIDLALASGTTGDAVRQLLPADAVLSDARSSAHQGDALSRAYRVNLDMLALVALLTGGFLVFSAQSLSVVRRLREFALVRTLGLPRSGIVATVAVEGVIVGIIGAGLGLAAGYALAAAALRLFGGDLGAGYFAEGGAGLVFAPWTALGFFALGLGAAVAGSVLPARRAARVAPAIALRNAGDLVDPREAVPWRAAAVLLAGGGAAALLPAVAGLPLFGFAGMALLLGGGVAGVPWLARQLLRPLVARRIAHVPADLAVRHLHGAPGQAATALCGIVASTALMIAMAVMVTSFRAAVDDWLGEILSADLYVRVEGGGGFDTAAQARLAAVPGVARIDFSRQMPLTVRADRPPVSLIARRDPAATMVLLGHAPALPPGTTPVWPSEPAARLYGWHVGDRIALPLGKGEPWRVAGIWRDYSRQQGAVAIRSGDYDRLTGDATRNEAAVMLRPHARAADVARGIKARVPPDLAPMLAIAEPGVLRRFALTLFDRSFAVTYLLEGVAIVVGLAGVAATMSAQTIARTREFGMLRHVGVSRGQVIAMLAVEGALLGLVGAVAGVLLGGVIAQVLIHVINPQSFNWTMDTHWPWSTIAVVIAALVVAAAGTAMVAGRRAVAVDAVRAVREDW